MAVGPLRPGGAQLPTVKAPQEKPQAEGQQHAEKALEKALDGVLKAGQHITVPARSGMMKFPDHFDARAAPNYDKLLKGLAQNPNEKSGEAASKSPEASGLSESATEFAASSAMNMLDLLPPIVVPPPVPMARAQNAPHVEDMEEAEPERDREREHGEQNPSAEDDERHSTDPEFAGPPAPQLEHRLVQLQAGLFTLAEGSVDVHERRLCTLEAFLDGDVPFVSCAVDLRAIPDGAELCIPALDALLGRRVPLRALHQNERTEGVGSAYLEICVSEPTEELHATLSQLVTVEIG